MIRKVLCFLILKKRDDNNASNGNENESEETKTKLGEIIHNVVTFGTHL